MKRSFALVLAAVLPLACKGSMSAEAKAEKKTAEYDKPMESAAPTDEGFGAPGSGAFQGEAMVGARHDLQLQGESLAATCKCLAVAVGNASDPAFFWQAGPPRVAIEDHLVMALTSEGIACPDVSPDSLGASYWGFKTDGPNVIIVVEEARFGRPITSGAILPRPGPDGHLYVMPVDARVPYGRPLSEGDRYCRVESRSPAPPP